MQHGSLIKKQKHQENKSLKFLFINVIFSSHIPLFIYLFVIIEIYHGNIFILFFLNVLVIEQKTFLKKRYFKGIKQGKQGNKFNR